MEVINKSVCRGVAGRRSSAKPNGVVIHNDAGSINATAKHYVDALARMSIEQLKGGFAHYYIDRNTIARTEDTYNMAWHTANANGNANYVGYEVCQSIGASKADFLANEQATLKQAAEDLKYWGLPANRNTVKLHNQFVATECPHRSQEIHGKGAACQDYFIQEINKFMNGSTTAPKPPTAGNSVNGANIPVKKDADRSIAHLDELKVNGNKLYTRGWHIGNYKYQYLIIIDANTNKEITRRLAKGVNRPDVNAMYKTSGDVGFSENFDLAQFKGRTVSLLARCTNDPKGNVAGGFSDIDFKQWPITVPK